MAVDEVLRTFAAEMYTELRYEADIEGAEAMLAEVFTRRVVETLMEVGEVEEAVQCFHVDDDVRPAVEVAGYGVEDGDTINLIATHFSGTPGSLSHSDVQRSIRRARAFWLRCRDRSYHDDLEESSDAWDMAYQLHHAAPGIRRVRIFLVTDSVAKIEWFDPELLDGVEYRQSVWDLTRLWRLETAGRAGEPIEIDFVERFGRPLPALPAPSQSEDYNAFLAVIPGDWLAAVYEEYGARLLERNVRSFLQFTGKVNKGMRDTIRQEPGRFLAYNNGISATASEIELAPLPEGGHGIARVRDLQIVNGGQTTASIHRAVGLKADVSRVSVQAKITEVTGDLLEELVPRISEYANSQNKVQVADLSSNHPFHIEIESLSRNVWAPATADTARQTRWFYERARGQYSDAVNREPTRARQRNFKAMHPPSQRFSKVDLGTFENTWDLEPHEVSKGAQKNFTRYMQRVQSRGPSFRPDASYFHRTVAKAILFRRAEKIVSAQNFGGYRRNIVTYALARLAYGTSQRIDLHRIWSEQELPPEITSAIEELAHLAFRVLTDPDRPAGNVTEWAKRPGCWDRMKMQPWRPSSALESILVPVGRGAGQPASNGGARRADGPQSADLGFLQDVDGDVFLAISNWAKQTDNLTPWQRRFAFTVGVAMKRQKPLTAKQAPHAKAILDEARARGFVDVSVS